MAPFILVPFMGFSFSYKCYRFALQAVIGTSLAKLGAKHGGPPLRGDGWAEKLDSLKRWFMPVQVRPLPARQPANRIESRRIESGRIE